MITSEAIRNEDDADYRHNLLKGAVSRVSEHFDSVVIIATAKDTNEGTYMQYASNGNIYASTAAAERWVKKQKSEWTEP